MANPALETFDLTVRFGGLVALEDVTIAVPEGKIVSIIGPNGAGKSTLLNGVSRLVRSQGAVRFFGREIKGEAPQDLIALGVARSFQDPQIMDGESVLENVLSGAYGRLGYSMLDQIVRFRKVADRERAAADRAREFLDMAGLAEQARRPCSELAYGPRKLIDILRGLMAEPRLMLLDEPSSGLDRSERKRIEQVLVKINRTLGVSMLVVEHHMDLVRSISDHVIALQSGRLLMQGGADEVLDSQGFRKAMVGGGA